MTQPDGPGIIVFGSLNMDLMVRVERAPRGGETLRGLGFLANPGGKGANQAVACARQGASVAMVGCVGHDAFGETLRNALASDGIDVTHVRSRRGKHGCRCRDGRRRGREPHHPRSRRQ